MAQGYHLNRRSKDRVNVSLKARYFIKEQSSQYRECRLINMSRTGAAVLFPADEQLTPGSVVLIDIDLSDPPSRFTAQAEIRRTERRNGDDERPNLELDHRVAHQQTKTNDDVTVAI